MAEFQTPDQSASWLEYSRSRSKFTSSVPQKQLPRCDMITFLGAAQKLRIDFLPITWHPSLDSIGQGGTAEIREAPVTTQFSFAFKRLISRLPYDFESLENLFLRYLIDEISILGHPRIRNHPTIVDIEGICWEIVAEKGIRISRETPICFNAGEQGIRPVLVFPKSKYGNLCDFMMQDRGKALNFSQRVYICIDVARALMEMHSQSIVHGDIKPQNVLIFDNDRKKNTHHKCTAKVTDFGYSTLWAAADDLIQMPRSQPWTAPEWHHRGFTPAQAALFDVYSFGMLVLWLLSHGNPKDSNRYFRLDSHASSNLAELVDRVVKDTFQTHNVDLGPFFDVTITGNIAKRCKDFNHLEMLLNPKRNYDSSTHGIWEMTHDKNEYKKDFYVFDKNESFQVIPSLHQLYYMDYRVRIHIVRLFLRKLDYLEGNKASNSILDSTLLQCAFCYELGFGITRDPRTAKELLEKCGGFDPKDFYRELELARRNQIKWIGARSYHPTNYHKMNRCQTSPSNTFQFLFDPYIAQEDPKEVELEYRKEIEDTAACLGSDHPFVLELKQELLILLLRCGRHNEVPKLKADIKDIISNSPRFEPSRAVAVKSIPALIDSLFWPRLRVEESLYFWSRAALPRNEFNFLDGLYTVASMTKDQTLLKYAEDLSTLKFGLLDLFKPENFDKVRDIRDRVREVTENVVSDPTIGSIPFHPSYMVAILAMQNHWSKAMALQTEIVRHNIKTLGHEDANTLNSMTQLAVIYVEGGQIQKAKTLLVQVVVLSEKILGKEHPETLQRLRGLAIRYQDQHQRKISLSAFAGRRYPSEEAERLHKKIVQLSTKLLGFEHPNTLNDASNWSWILYHQKRYKESEKLEAQVRKASIRVLGKDHPETLVSTVNLAFAIRKQGRWKEAQLLLNEGIKKSSFLSRVSSQIQFFLLLII